MAAHDEGVSCGGGALDAPAAVLATALQAYVAVTGDGRVVAWNPAATATFGYSQQDACGRLIDELIIPERFRTAHRVGLARVMAGGTSQVLRPSAPPWPGAATVGRVRCSR